MVELMQIEDFLQEAQEHQKEINFQNIEKACKFADEAHKGQLRKSHDPYITHPISVAYSLLQYNFDEATIIAGILHDVIEDTLITKEEIEKEFGAEITRLVLGVTKLTKINFDSAEIAKVENFRKFILAMVDDIRVLVIKIFDRLDNMRTINHITKEEKRIRIAKETLDIFVPMVERISLHDIKEELEDLCFKVIEPKSYNFINKKLKSLKSSSKLDFSKIINLTENFLRKRNIPFKEIQGRLKKPYSIWKKIRLRNSKFEDIFDVVAFRIIMETEEDCYRALYVLHTNYKAIFERFKDYISSPKPNNYQSIHTCVIMEDNTAVEFQIRTTEMHDFAEHGISAHWNYKSPTDIKYFEKYTWLNNLLNLIYNKNLDIEDIYEYSKVAVFTDEVFVFTPKGEIKSLPAGATALDFAYEIHSNIGNGCKEVYIDGIRSPLYTKLKNGQKVEVVYDDKLSPQVMWLSFVKTGFAKFSIKKHLKQKYNNEIRKQAHSILSYAFEKEGVIFHQELIHKMMENINLKSEILFCERIIEGKIKIPNLIQNLFPNVRIKAENNIYKDAISLERISFFTKDVYFSDCCYPVWEDTIVGVIIPGDRLEIHHSNCEVLYSSNMVNLSIIRVKWTKENNHTYKAKIRVLMLDTPGAFASVTQILAQANINILSISYNHAVRSKGESSNDIILFIKDRETLEQIMEQISNSSYVKYVERQYN